MKRYILFILMMLIAMSFIAGCGDDDETTAPNINRTMVFGEAYLTPDVRMYTDFMPASNNATRVDSVDFGGRMTYIIDSYWDTYGDENYYYTRYSNSADTLEFEEGDTIDITYYKGNDQATCMLKLLYDDNSPTFISPDNNDSVDIGEAVTFTWNSNEFADWYGMRISYYWDSSGYQGYRTHTFFTLDTTFTLDGSYVFDDGYFYLYLVSVAGPVPGQDNIVSSTMLGTMHSSTYSQSRRIYVGTGSTGGPMSSSKINAVESPDEIRHDILKSLFR